MRIWYPKRLDAMETLAFSASRSVSETGRSVIQETSCHSFGSNSGLEDVAYVAMSNKSCQVKGAIFRPFLIRVCFPSMRFLSASKPWPARRLPSCWALSAGSPLALAHWSYACWRSSRL